MCGQLDESDIHWWIDNLLAHSTGAVEYIDCITAVEYPHLNECPRYDIKPSNVEALALEI